MEEICNDLFEEGQALEELLAGLSTEEWGLLTPFSEWTIKDEVSHLAYFDRLARISATDEGRCSEIMAELAGLADFFQETLAEGRALAPAELFSWYRTERREMIEAFRRLAPKTRVPWQMPMSARSSATARLMETWAHGQDVFDTLGVEHKASQGLRHIAHLGVATFGWSFKCRGMEAPSEAVRVELKGPSGEPWAWGPEAAENRISGNAKDFCLVVTQRRHYLDTRLRVSGKTAELWMQYAQAFAGPPALGPPAGRFSMEKQ
jgi:uncharacterized protein (TIGR03084 family)